MYYRSFRRKPKYVYDNNPPRARVPKGGGRARTRKKNPLVPLALFAAAALFICSWVFMRDLSTQIAVSDACDLVTTAVNRAVNEIIREGDYEYEYFVDLSKDDTGQVTAVSCNMGRINKLSTDILDRVVNNTENGEITVEIPLGNLTGLNVLMGRGPNVPVRIIYLTSSFVNFSNDIVTAGINQTKHQLNLEITVDIDILIPWSTQSVEVVTDVLVADTIIVGRVPDTYLNMEK